MNDAPEVLAVVGATIIDYRSISLVMKDGKVIDRDALPTQRLVRARPVV